MSRLAVKAYAKINLTLEIAGRRADGYHELKSVMQTIDLCDTIILDDSAPTGSVEVRCEASRPGGFPVNQLPQGKDNICYEAARIMMKRTNYTGGLSVTVKKSIPMAAGLAGGSADAAAVLRGLNRMWSSGLTTRELEELARPLGADIPFCVRGGTCITRGIGDILEPVEPAVSLNYVLVVPNVVVSTAQVYALYDQNGNNSGFSGQHNHEERLRSMRDALVSGDLREIAGLLYNDLERVTARKWPVVGEWKKILSECPGCLGSIMSGSGPAVYGIMKSREDAVRLASSFENGNVFCVAVRSVDARELS